MAFANVNCANVYLVVPFLILEAANILENCKIETTGMNLTGIRNFNRFIIRDGKKIFYLHLDNSEVTVASHTQASCESVTFTKRKKTQRAQQAMRKQ